MANCFKCGTKVGFFSGAIVGDKHFCTPCYKTLTDSDRIRLGGYECRQCAYFTVDSGYESSCRKKNMSVDRNRQACSDFHK